MYPKLGYTETKEITTPIMNIRFVIVAVAPVYAGLHFSGISRGREKDKESTHFLSNQFSTSVLSIDRQVFDEFMKMTWGLTGLILLAQRSELIFQSAS